MVKCLGNSQLQGVSAKYASQGCTCTKDGYQPNFWFANHA